MEDLGGDLDVSGYTRLCKPSPPFELPEGGCDVSTDDSPLDVDGKPPSCYGY